MSKCKHVNDDGMRCHRPRGHNGPHRYEGQRCDATFKVSGKNLRCVLPAGHRGQKHRHTKVRKLKGGAETKSTVEWGDPKKLYDEGNMVEVAQWKMGR